MQKPCKSKINKNKKALATFLPDRFRDEFFSLRLERVEIPKVGGSRKQPRKSTGIRWIKQLFCAGIPPAMFRASQVHCHENFMKKIFSINFLWRHMNVKARKCARAQSSPTTTTPVVVGNGIEFTLVCRWCALWIGAGANECGCHWGNIACRYQHDRNTWRTRIFTNDVMEYEKWFGIMSDKDKAGEARKSFSFIQCGKLLPMERRIRTQNKNVPQSSGRAPLQSFFFTFFCGKSMRFHFS